MSVLRLAIAGCTGRMGRALVRRAAADPDFQIVAALARPDDPALGHDAGPLAGAAALQVPVSTECPACDVLVEFTTPAGCRSWANWSAENGVPLVSGTTGLSQRDHAALASAAERVPVVWAANMSVGVNLLLRLAAELARTLDAGWDVEITETHHRDKLDAPSGTARALLEAVCRARQSDPARVGVFGRQGASVPRRAGEVGVHALRGGDNVGEHEVHFAAAGEVLSIRHRATSRDVFAVGALRAARWVAGRRPGLYGMRDVLGC